MHPTNLAFRFVLEVFALGVMARWGYQQTESAWRWAFAIGVPLAAAAMWTIFAVPGDPSRGGEGFVHVPGLLRLGLEFAVFGFATWALNELGQTPLAIGCGVAVIAHYALSYERLVWLVGS